MEPEEVRRRERVIRISPNQDSAVRFIGALLAEQHETWSTGRRYLNMTDFLEWEQEGKLRNEENSGQTMLKAMPA